MEEVKIVETFNEELNESEIYLSKEQEYLNNTMENTITSIFIGGPAGVGKSILIRYFIENTTKEIAVLAPTGVAALNIAGQTIHSFFELPPTIQNMENKSDQEIEISPKLRKKISILETMVIDEISMVNPDLMEAVNRICQIIKKNSLPFGGIQVICFGDLYQLPPVISNKIEYKYLVEKYGGIFFFNAPSIQEDLKIYELTHIFRQKNQNFKELLNKIRVGNCSKDIIDTLNTRVALPEEENIITLATTNATVASINKSKLEKINSEEKVYTAKITGLVKENSFPSDYELHLKVGAQVMLTVNLSHKKGLINGSLGTITKLDEEYIVVKINGVEHQIKPYEWENYETKYNSTNHHLEKEVIGTYTQFPLKLAWAITIHKSQGKTFQSVYIDLGTGAFDAGQLYVALSRCTSLEKIYLKNPIKPSDVKVSMEVVNFMKNAEVIRVSEAEDSLS